MRRIAAIALASLATLGWAPCVRAADNLRLAGGLSFTDDSSDRFPIEAEHLDDADLGSGKVTVAFFGAAHCWNTNREAERLVAVYPRFRDRVRFIVVDVNHPSTAQRRLMEKHYAGYIPTVVVWNADGSVVYSRAGETADRRGDASALERLLETAAGRSK